MVMFGKNKLTRREPLMSENPLSQIHREIDQLFNRFIREPFGLGAIDGPFSQLGEWGPTMDVRETDANVSFVFELPGVEPKDVDISVTDNMLTIRGEKTEETGTTEGASRHQERRYGSFSRSVSLPAGADAGKIDATFKNGVLTVSVAKRPDAKPKKITVKTA